VCIVNISKVKNLNIAQLFHHFMKLITNPDEFFAELKQRDVRIRVPLLTIVLPVAVIMALYQFLLMTKFSQIFPRELAQFFMVGA